MKLTTLGWMGLAAIALTGTPIGCFDSHAPTCTVDCTSDNECPSGLTCGPSNKCSEDGAACADAKCTADAVRCQPGAASTIVETCDAQGNWNTTETCATGCKDGAGIPAHCAHVEPTYTALRSICDTPADAGPRMFDTSASFSTDDPLFCTTAAGQGGGPQICVMRAETITVALIADLTFTGSRPIAFVADGDITLDGSIFVHAAGIADGPGGGGLGLISGEGSTGRFGGGGAGFRTIGANGGGGAAGGGMMGGSMGPNPTTSPLLLGGYRPATAVSSGTEGGGAGGALALISCTGTVHVNHTLDAGGGGGARGGDYGVGGFRSGAGGGSGGVISIQAMHVEVGISGTLYANGGGGGGGGTTAGNFGEAGEDGTQSDLNCALGGGAVGTGGTGGNGACVNRGPLDGNGDSASKSAGGGGGSMGYIIVYTPPGVGPSLANADPPSPPLSLATVVLR